MVQAHTRRAALTALGLAALAPLHALAQPQERWPNKAVRIIVPYPPGGFPDVLCRLLAEQLGRSLATPVIVENRPGASGALGVRALNSQPYEGHTFVLITSGHVTLSALSRNFDLLRDTKPIVRVADLPFIFVVNSSSPYQQLADLLKGGQASGGKLAYGSSGQGSPPHMAVEYLIDKVPGFNAVHVPYKGAVESANALLGSQISFTAGNSGALLPLIKSGKLRGLAVTSSRRIPAAAVIPTVAEAGIPGYAFASWVGLVGHKDAPDAVVQRMHLAVADAAASDPVKRLLEDSAAFLDLSSSPGAFKESLKRDIAAERATVRRLGIPPND
jgi:tripartite-type tricarboxylate transporter receptor subunit TctC